MLPLCAIEAARTIGLGGRALACLGGMRGGLVASVAMVACLCGSRGGTLAPALLTVCALGRSGSFGVSVVAVLSDLAGEAAEGLFPGIGGGGAGTGTSERALVGRLGLRTGSAGAADL